MVLLWVGLGLPEAYTKIGVKLEHAGLVVNSPIVGRNTEPPKAFLR